MSTDQHSLKVTLENYKETRNPDAFHRLISQKYRLAEFKQLLQNIFEEMKDIKHATIKVDILTLTILHCDNMKRVYAEYVQFLNLLLINKEKANFVYGCIKQNLLGHLPTQKEEAFGCINLYVTLANIMTDPYDKYICISMARDVFNVIKGFPSREITFLYFSIIAEFFLQSHNFICFLNAIYRMAKIERKGIDLDLLKRTAMICQYKNNRDYGFFGPLTFLMSDEIVEFFTKKNFEKNFDFKFDFQFYDLINNLIHEKNESALREKDITSENKEEVIDIMKRKKRDTVENGSVILKEHVDVSIVNRSYYLKKELRAKQKKNILEVVPEKKIVKEKPKPVAVKVEKKKIKKKLVLDCFRHGFNVFKVYFEKLKESVPEDEDRYYNMRKERYDTAFYETHNENNVVFSVIDQNLDIIDVLCVEIEEKCQKDVRGGSVMRESRRNIINSNDSSVVNKGGEGSVMRRRGSKLLEMHHNTESNVDDRHNFESSRNNLSDNKESERTRGSKLPMFNEANNDHETKEVRRRGSKLPIFEDTNPSDRYSAPNSAYSGEKYSHEGPMDENPHRERKRGSKLASLGDNRNSGTYSNHSRSFRDDNKGFHEYDKGLMKNDNSNFTEANKSMRSSESKLPPAFSDNQNREKRRGSKLSEISGDRIDNKADESRLPERKNPEIDLRVRVRGSKLVQSSKRTNNLESKIKNLKIDDASKDEWRRTPKK